MPEAIEWIKANWNQLVVIWGLLTAICTAIVALTPTKKDDELLTKVRNFVVKIADWFSVVNPREKK